MRKAAAIFLFVLFTLPLWVKGVVLLHFMANRAYIVEHFCENKDKPQLHCEGKCYLHKQLKKTEPVEQDRNASPVASWLKKWELAAFDLPRQFLEIPTGLWVVTNPFFHYRAVALCGFSDILEQPPDWGEHRDTGAPSPAFSLLFILQFYKSCT